MGWTVRISKGKGHADDGMVLHGRVREVDSSGNNAVAAAADFGRRRVGNAVIDAHRNLSGVSGRWYPVILDLHRFFIAISRAVVNHDDRDPHGIVKVCLYLSLGVCSSFGNRQIFGVWGSNTLEIVQDLAPGAQVHWE